MQREHKDVVSVVYTGDNASKEDIIKTVQVRAYTPINIHLRYRVLLWTSTCLETDES